jgi:hypothetical protein
MAYCTARISAISACFSHVGHGNTILSVAVVQISRQMAQLTQVRTASRKSKEIDFGGLIDIQIKSSKIIEVGYHDTTHKGMSADCRYSCAYYPATMHPEKENTVPTKQKTRWSPELTCTCFGEEKSVALAGIRSQDRLACGLVTILTTLSRLHLMSNMKFKLPIFVA